MKFRVIFLALLFLIFFIALHPSRSFSQQPDSCLPHTICVHPGDLLKYSVVLDTVNSTKIYKFSNILDPIHIKIIEQNSINKNEIQNNNLTLNIKTGFVTNEQDANIVKPFVSVLTSPVDYNKSDASITPVVTDFYGFKRSTLNVFHSNENNTSEIEYDLETGILLNIHTASIIKINDKYKVVNFSNKLTSTSMIYSNSKGFQNIKNMISIPNWVKSTSKWWSEDKIPNSEFVKTVQYMTSNGMILVQFDSSSAVPLQSIPMWIKHNVRWWTGGQISDDEFVKGIQWLINNKIIII